MRPTTVRRITNGREGGDIWKVTTSKGTTIGTAAALADLAAAILEHIPTHPENQ